jgi:hypothetical protein
MSLQFAKRSVVLLSIALSLSLAKSSSHFDCDMLLTIESDAEALVQVKDFLGTNIRKEDGLVDEE